MDAARMIQTVRWIETAVHRVGIVLVSCKPNCDCQRAEVYQRELVSESQDLLIPAGIYKKPENEQNPYPDIITKCGGRKG